MLSERSEPVRLALPSKGMEAETLAFMQSCGLAVHRPNPRQYTATVSRIPDMVVIFQRAGDILAKVDERSVDLGITGLDVVHEHDREGSDVLILHDALGYGRCSLLLAVPEAWLDVTSVGDLAEIATRAKAGGRELRVATKYANLTQAFLYERGINHFRLVEAQGAIEAAPRMGYADVVSDIVETGTTLKDNGLKPISGGTMLQSQACLIGNRRSLRENPRCLAAARVMLELFEARLRARRYYSITANIRGDSAEAVARRVSGRTATAGLRGPTVARVHAPSDGGQDWYAVTVIVPGDDLLAAVDHLRDVGGSSVTVHAVEYIFAERCAGYDRLLAALEGRLAPAG